MRILLSVLVVLFFLVGQAVAQDPCANESGAGFGLCNAYCVAMDCDNPDPDAIQASGEACNKVAANYEKIMGKELLCGVECPCYSGEEADNFIANVAYGHIQCIMNTDYPSIYGINPSPSSQHDLLQSQEPPVDWCYKRTGLDSPVVVLRNDLTEAEALACYNILNDRMNEVNCDEILP